MRRVCGACALVLLAAVSLGAAPQAGVRALASVDGTVTAIWDASTDGATGYRLYYSLTPGLDETAAVRVDTSATSVPVSGLLASRTYYFHVRAVTAAGLVSAPSVEVAFLVPGVPPVDPCAFPLGATSVSIFVTGKLNRTGSGGPGSRAFITFQAASPNSPITVLSIRANGVDVPDSVTEGVNLRAPGSLWFTIPPGAMIYTVYGKNAAGCAREQPTGFSTGP